MRKNYNFSEARTSPYAKRLKKQITICNGEPGGESTCRTPIRHGRIMHVGLDGSGSQTLCEGEIVPAAITVGGGGVYFIEWSTRAPYRLAS